MATVRINRAATYRRVKGVIARDRGIDQGDFQGLNTLQGGAPKGLGYSPAGQRDLAPKLEERFEDVELVFTRDDAGKATTVSSMAALVWAEILPAHRAAG